MILGAFQGRCKVISHIGTHHKYNHPLMAKKEWLQSLGCSDGDVPGGPPAEGYDIVGEFWVQCGVSDEVDLIPAAHLKLIFNKEHLQSKGKGGCDENSLSVLDGQELGQLVPVPGLVATEVHMSFVQEDSHDPPSTA